jgi:beta-galactosidase
MLDHQGRKDATYDETAAVYAELARLAPVIDATRFVASTAILYSDEIGWAWNHIVSTRLRPLMERWDVSMQGRMLRWYAPLYKAKVPTDILDPLRDLSGYEVVFAPNLYLVNSAIVQNLKRYVRDGGFLIVGPKAGLKDWDNVFCAEVPPCGGLAQLLGATVKPSSSRMWFGGPLEVEITMQADAPFAAGMSFANEGLLDNLEPTSAKPVALHESGDAAITLNAYGAGAAMYVGCEPEATFHRHLVEWLVAEGKIEPALSTDADVEITVRAGGGHRLIFVLNHNAEPVQIALGKAYHELISDQPVSGTLAIEGNGVRILFDS